MIPAGIFVMGSPEGEEARSAAEGPQHRVTFAAPFALGKYPVTFEEYDHFCIESGREKPPDQGWGRGRRPVINVSWEDAKAYCAWLSEQTGQAVSPAERGGVGVRLPGGDDDAVLDRRDDRHRPGELRRQLHYGPGSKGEYREQTTPVDGFAANPWGLHDMHGNVWEWCEDCWNDSYAGRPEDGSAWTTRRLRAAGCCAGAAGFDDPGNLRSAYRGGDLPAGRFNFIGFRVARTLSLRESVTP